uniref:Uncharacterized protein n=1 Tax=Oryza sativa subsp. japonica TaxID=39947 RepID=Q6K7L7_ORYSJ|nr:hypothetical protein [Oryza sativa Japonica Group]BAD28985.1 hypothetical protein [Oryza sativa Japonica Group]
MAAACGARHAARRRRCAVARPGVASCRDDVGVGVGNEAAGGNREGERDRDRRERAEREAAAWLSPQRCGGGGGGGGGDDDERETTARYDGSVGVGMP